MSDKINDTSVRNVIIETVPMAAQRYNTVGDWYFDDVAGKRVLRILVSDTGNWRWNMALALHELAEAVLCTSDDVPQSAVDTFDMNWKSRLEEDDEPGDDVNAPYHKQHRDASDLEVTFFDQLFGKKKTLAIWHEYEAKLSEMTKEYAENEERRRQRKNSFKLQSKEDK